MALQVVHGARDAYFGWPAKREKKAVLKVHKVFPSAFDAKGKRH